MRIDNIESERLSLLRFPLIVGVIFIHAYGTEVGLASGVVGLELSSPLSSFVRNLISQGFARTAVPLFFLMSGYLFFLNFHWSITNYKKKINSRLKTLLIPFLFWNFLTLLLYALAQYLPVTKIYFSGANEPISTFGLYDYLNAIIGIDRMPISYQFWFIRDLIVVILLTPVISIAVKRAPVIILFLIFTLWFFNLWPIYVPSIAALFFFYVGAYFANANTSLFSLDRFGLLILPSYLIILFIDVLTKEKEFNIYIHNSGVLLGLASVLFFSKLIVRSTRVKSTLLWAGTCSFFVFAVHEPLLTLLRKIIYKMVSPNSDLMVVFLYISIPILVIVLSVSLYVGMKSTIPKFLSVISGGR